MSEEVHMQCMEVWGGNEVIDTAVTLPGLDAWVYAKPCDADSGGDVHYVSSCAMGRITRLLLADVSGHGSAVASTATQLRHLMQRFVNHINQTRFVESMNEHFSALAKTGTFATAIVSTYYARTNRLSLCNAGHPPPLVYCAREGNWSVLEERAAANIPLGIEQTRYEQFEVKLALGDAVFCFTDSLTESKGADGEMLGMKGLLDVVRSVKMGEPAEFVANLRRAIEGLYSDNLTKDDVTMLLFRVNDSAPQAPFWVRVIAPFRVLWAVGKSASTRWGGVRQTQ